MNESFQQVAELLNASEPTLRFVHHSKYTLRIDFWSSEHTLWVDMVADGHFEYHGGSSFGTRCATINEAIIRGLAACKVSSQEQLNILRALSIGD